ncbi:MAG: hypothetical protein ACK4UU_04960, partial [Fimbriimonadales bacterium]
MSLNQIEIPIEEFGQIQFTDWVRTRKKEILTEYLNASEAMPYSEIMKKFSIYFESFVEEKVREKIKSESVEFINFRILGEKPSEITHFFRSLSDSLRRAIVREYGVSGFVPLPFTSAIISDIRYGVRKLQECAKNSNRSRRHGGALSPQVLRIA